MNMIIKALENLQRQCLRIFLIALSFLYTSLAFADDFPFDYIYYRINGSEVTVIGAASGLSIVIIPSTVTYNGTTYSVTAIGEAAFNSCSNLTSVTIPNSVTSIGSYAFYGCTGLTSVTIPNPVTNIGSYAFCGCTGLTSVIIPSSVTVIGEFAFEYCTGLTSVTITDIAAWCGINFNNQKSNPLSYAHHLYLDDSEIINLVIPNSVTSISNGAFFDCDGLTSVTIPNSVTSIGISAFESCNGVTTVTISNSITSISGSAFFGCTGLTRITIPNSVTNIGSYAFSECTGLTNVIIPNSVTNIGSCAFSSCSSLTSVSIPNTVTSLGSGAFDGCSSLTSVAIPYLVTTINGYVFRGCTGLINVKLPKTLKSIGASAFSNCSSLTSVTIPESVTSIGSYAFSGSGLTNVTIPSSVTTIGNSAFRNCIGLKTVTITSHLTSLGEYSFSGCSALSYLTCLPQTPPILENSNCFSTYNTTCLYVPRLGVENYKTHTNWRRFAKIYEFVGHFTVPDVNVSKGKTVVVPVSMTNEADIIGFQTDIYLPEGFEFVKDGNDYVVDQSDRMARDHSIMCNVSGDGALRVLCYSPTNKVISGNEGELFYVTIKAPADTVGDFSLCFKNTILTTSDAEELLSPDAYTNINVIPYLPGDVNGNGEVSVIDIVTAAQYIIFQNPDPFLFEAADLNNDEQITVTDLALIANLILYPTMNAPKRVPAFDLSDNRIYGNDIQLNVGETRTVNITLDNLEEYSAFQLDVKLPSGLTASNFKMVNQSSRHSFITSEEKDGMIRVLCYSPSLATLNNGEKTLLTFDVTATGNTARDIIIDGIELVTTACQPVHLDALAISVNPSSTINEVSNSKRVAQMEYYNLAGQKLAEPAQGLTIVVTTYTDGSRTTQKVVL